MEVNRQEKINPSRGNKRSTDHPADISHIPGSEDVSFAEDDWKLYELVCRRFIATLLPLAELKSVSASIDAGGETFIANGSNVIKANWIAHYPYYKHEDVYIPELSRGQKLKISGKGVSGQGDKTSWQDIHRANWWKKWKSWGLDTKVYPAYYNPDPYKQEDIQKAIRLCLQKKAIAVIKMLKKHAERISTPDMTAELENGHGRHSKRE